MTLENLSQEVRIVEGKRVDQITFVARVSQGWQCARDGCTFLHHRRGGCLHCAVFSFAVVLGVEQEADLLCQDQYCHCHSTERSVPLVLW